MDPGPIVGSVPGFQDLAGLMRFKDFTRIVEDLLERWTLRLRDGLPVMSHEEQVSDFEYCH